MRIVQCLVIFMMTILWSLCSPVGKLTPEKDRAAKSLEPSADKALVYIVRPPKYGKTVMHVYVDGKYLGTTASARYLYVLLDPGIYKFESDAENISELLMQVEPGKTYFIEQKVKMGILQQRNELIRLNEKEGRSKLSQCALSSEFNENW